MSPRSLLRTGIISSLLALALAISAAPSIAQAACIKELGGPTVDEYLDLVKTGRVSAVLYGNGSAEFTNGSECTIVVRLSAIKLLTGTRESAFSTTEAVYVPSGAKISLVTPVPECNFRLEIMPFATPQYDTGGRRIVHAETFNALGSCGLDDAPYGAEPVYPTSSSSSSNPRGRKYNAPKKKVTSCINVSAQAYDMNDKLESSMMSGVHIFVDEKYKGTTDVKGKLQIADLSEGNHTVSQSLVSGWTVKSVSPKGATVKTTSKAGCKSVTFRNRRTQPSKLDEDMKITVSDVLFEPGQELTYTLFIRNGSLKKKTVSAEATADPLTTILYTTDGGKTTSSTVTWKKLVLAPNSTTRLSVTVRVRAGSLPRTQLRFSARAGALFASAVTPMRISETLYGSAFREAELSIVPGGTEAQSGGAVRFTVALRNTTLLVLPNVTLTFSFDENDVFFPSYAGGKRLAQGVLQWNFSALQPNEQRRIDLNGEVISSSGSSIHVSASARSPLLTQVQMATANVFVLALAPQTVTQGDMHQVLLPQTGIQTFNVPPATVIHAGPSQAMEVSSGAYTMVTVVLSLIGVLVGALAVAKKIV